MSLQTVKLFLEEQQEVFLDLIVLVKLEGELIYSSSKPTP